MNLEQQVSLFIKNTTHVINEDELKRKLQSGRSLSVKFGVDPTAPHVTLGWAVVFRKLRDFQQLGHKACLVIGDFTARIGDPSGKSKTRPQLTSEEVKNHTDSVLQQIYKILDPEKTEIYFNNDWLGKMSFEDVLKLASHYTVARMLERDDFTIRLREDKPIALHEILYPLCQGYDSVHLKADIELGGNDQLFNHLVGRHLMSHYGLEPQVIILSPLLVGTDGKEKMSQSLGNYISITDSPNDMYGKTMSIPDQLIQNWFELTTDVPHEEITDLISQMHSGALNPRDAKRRLAREIVTLYHGKEAAEEADAFFIKTFSQRQQPVEAEIAPIPSEFSGMDKISLAHLINALGMTKSNAEARRLMIAGGVKLGLEKIADPTSVFPPSELDGKILRVGKHQFRKIKA